MLKCASHISASPYRFFGEDDVRFWRWLGSGSGGKVGLRGWSWLSRGCYVCILHLIFFEPSADKLAHCPIKLDVDSLFSRTTFFEPHRYTIDEWCHEWVILRQLRSQTSAQIGESPLRQMPHLANRSQHQSHPKMMWMPAAPVGRLSSYSGRAHLTVGSFLHAVLMVCSECNIDRMTLNNLKFSHPELPLISYE